MAQVTWKTATSGLWQTGSDWSNGTGPGTTDDALLTVSGSPYTVTVSGLNVTVNSVQLSANATLDINGGSSFTMTSGTGSGANAGTIIVENNDFLFWGGNVNNSGTIELNANGNLSDVRLNASMTLSGGGKVIMSDNANNRIFSAPGNGTLTNVNDIIAGAGQIGVGQTVVVNESKGVIDGTGTNALVLSGNNGSVWINSGKIESTSTGGLIINNNTTIDSTSGGTIQAIGKGSNVQLANATLRGGTLATSGGGVIETVSGNGGLDGTHGAVNNTGSFVVSNATDLFVAGTINNTGTITVNSSGNTTNMILTSPTVLLTGGGLVSMSNNGANQIFGSVSGDTLINVNDTIAGSGNLGANQMTLVNGAKGVIDANQTTQLVVQTPNFVTNLGLMESTSTGGLLIQGTVVDNAGGTISAAGGNVNLGNGSTIQGGTLDSSGGGVIETVGGNGGIDGVTFGAVTLAGTVVVNNATQLFATGTINDAGSTIELNAGVNTTQLRITDASLTLQGGGSVVLSNSDNNQIVGNSNFTQTLINVDNTITGTGNIGANQMTLVNESAGVIDANNVAIAGTTSGVLVLQANGGITNAGLIEGTGSAGLQISGSFVNNLGGTIKAGNGSNVNLVNGVSIEGGTLTTVGTGIIQVSVGQSASLDGVESGIGAVNNKGTVVVQNASVLFLDGVINNTGTIELSGAANFTDLRLGTQTVTLTGGGQIVMSSSPNNRIFGASNGTQQLINVDNTISGAGQLGSNQMTFVNEASGVVNANQSATALILQTNGMTTNSGLLEDTGAGGLQINSTAVFQTSSGIIAAIGAGSHVDLNSSDIIGGTLTTSSGGVIQATSGISTLDGLTAGAITNAGSLLLNNNTFVQLLGTINNTGTISMAAGPNLVDLRLQSNVVTLQGGGSILMTDDPNNRIFGNSSVWDTLVNNGNTISGAGQFGAGGMQFSNSGTIEATGTTNSLAVNLGTSGESGVNNNGGFMIGAGAAGLVFQNGNFTNNGTIEALNGSNVTFQSGAVNLNASGGTLTSGTWEAVSTGAAATVSITGGPISTDEATIILSGTGSAFLTGNGATQTAIETTLTTIATGGSLALEGGRVYTSTLALSDSGTISLAGKGTTLGAASLTINKGGALSGNGAVKSTVTDNGAITASGGTLDITKNVTGTGTVTIASGATFEADAKLAAKTVTFATGGTAQVLALKTPSTTTSTIAGWGKGTAIDLLNIGATNISYAGTTTSGTLTIKSGTSTVATLKFTGDYTTSSFSAPVSDGHNGTLITGTGLALASAADLTGIRGIGSAASHATQLMASFAGGSGGMHTSSALLDHLLMPIHNA